MFGYSLFRHRIAPHHSGGTFAPRLQRCTAPLPSDDAPRHACKAAQVQVVSMSKWLETPSLTDMSQPCLDRSPHLLSDRRNFQHFFREVCGQEESEKSQCTHVRARCALVTGGLRGLGLAVAQRLAATKRPGLALDALALRQGRSASKRSACRMLPGPNP